MKPSGPPLSTSGFIEYIFLVFLVLSFVNTTGAQTRKDVYFQPFDDIKSVTAKSIFVRFKKMYPQSILLPPITLPHTAFYSPRSRYLADSLIRFLRRSRIDKRSVIIGLTTKDISVRKGSIPNFGLMGLAFCPGASCVVSSFRVDQSKVEEQLFKLVLHELSHTQGLPHCSLRTCFMRDAKGRNHLDDEKGFCPKCKSVLIRNGWQL